MKEVAGGRAGALPFDHALLFESGQITISSESFFSV
jgi:hypothetical protein